MGTFHMGIMLHFNNSETLSYSELLQHTRLPDKELTKQLQSLVETKIIDTEVRLNCLLTQVGIIVLVADALNLPNFTDQLPAQKNVIDTNHSIKLFK